MEGFAGELRAVVCGDDFGQAAGAGEILKQIDDGGAADGGIDMEGEALACEVIDEGEAAETSAVGKLVMNEVTRPPVVWGIGMGQRDAGDGRQLATSFPTQGKTFLAVKPLGAFVIDDQTFGLEHIVKDGRTPAWF
jgi:hypothetical protein